MEKTQTNYEDLAVKYAERYGIIDFRHSGKIMTYMEEYTEGKYHVEVDLDSLDEKRTLFAGC